MRGRARSGTGKRSRKKWVFAPASGRHWARTVAIDGNRLATAELRQATARRTTLLMRANGSHVIRLRNERAEGKKRQGRGIRYGRHAQPVPPNAMAHRTRLTCVATGPPKNFVQIIAAS